MQEYSSSIWTGPVLNNDNDLRQSRDVRDAPIAYLVRSAGPKNCSNPVLNSRDNLLWGDALPHGSSSICVLWIVSWELGLDCEAGREAYLPLFQWVQEVSIARTCGSKSFAEREDRGDARHLWLKLGETAMWTCSGSREGGTDHQPAGIKWGRSHRDADAHASTFPNVANRWFGWINVLRSNPLKLRVYVFVLTPAALLSENKQGEGFTDQ